MNEFSNNFSPEKRIIKKPVVTEILGRKILDVGNNEGALIGQDELFFVAVDNGGRFEELEDVQGVTSHGFMGCAEVIGEFSNGERFYFHSYGPSNLKKFIEKIMTIRNAEEVVITDVSIRGEFGRNASVDDDKAEFARDQMRQYESICKKYSNDDSVFEIQEESITGSSGEKVVGYSWTENRP